MCRIFESTCSSARRFYASFTFHVQTSVQCVAVVAAMAAKFIITSMIHNISNSLGRISYAGIAKIIDFGGVF